MAPKAADKNKKATDKAKVAAKQKVLHTSKHTALLQDASVHRLTLLCSCQVAEDKTFGLKNKNKSAKVQK